MPRHIRVIIIFAIATVILYSALGVSLVRAESIYFGGWSKHNVKYGSFKPNETHNMLLIEKDGNIGGYFKTSFNDHGFMFAKQILKIQIYDIQFSIDPGLTLGYRHCSGKHAPEKDVKFCLDGALEFQYTKFKLRPVILVKTDATVALFNWSF